MQKSALYEARYIFLILCIAWALLLVWFPWLALVITGMMVFTVYFFRDPERRPPSDMQIAVAAADGKVVEIEEIEESEILKKPMVRISIFLSIFDVHVNRSPISGRITESRQRSGNYLDARDPASSEKNAARIWIIEGTHTTVAVRQITGAIARRIVPWSRVGDTIKRGEKFGMIRFGSRTEIYLPLGSEILTTVGDRVRAGESPIARLGEDSK